MPYVRAKVTKQLFGRFIFMNNKNITQVIDIHTGEPLPKGERGEILIKSPAIMKGYFINGEIQV